MWRDRCPERKEIQIAVSSLKNCTIMLYNLGDPSGQLYVKSGAAPKIIGRKIDKANAEKL